jgi:hypothetical protein
MVNPRALPPCYLCGFAMDSGRRKMAFVALLCCLGARTRPASAEQRHASWKPELCELCALTWSEWGLLCPALLDGTFWGLEKKSGTGISVSPAPTCVGRVGNQNPQPHQRRHYYCMRAEQEAIGCSPSRFPQPRPPRHGGLAIYCFCIASAL